MGRSEYTSRAPRFRAAEVTNVMGRSELDLRDAKIPPGGEATVQVFSAMGEVTVRVPPNWTVDTRAIPAMGAVRDHRFGTRVRHGRGDGTGTAPGSSRAGPDGPADDSVLTIRRAMSNGSIGLRAPRQDAAARGGAGDCAFGVLLSWIAPTTLAAQALRLARRAHRPWRVDLAQSRGVGGGGMASC
jgi:hypothetical protein